MEDRFKYKILNTKTNKFVEKGIEQYLLRDDGVICLCYFESIDPMHDLKPIFCTGLKDKTGKLIYEGDVISISRLAVYEDKPFITDVYFDKGCFRYRFKDNSGGVLDFNSTKLVEGYESVTQDVEIIGNIYENPELIKGDDEWKID